MSPPIESMAATDEIEVEIEKLVAGGDGLARFGGLPIFVPRSAPGDRARVRIVERRADYARAELVQVLSPGPGRREPPCRYFEKCGGCDLQHLEDDLQVELKVEAARESLTRLGGLELPARQRVIAGPAWAYRLRAQLQVEPSRGDRPAAVGYFARGTHDLVAVKSCPILVPALEGLLPRLARILGEKAPRRLDLLAAGDEVTSAPVVPGIPHGEVSIEVGEFCYRLDARVFFQAHNQLLPQLIDAVVGPSEALSETAYDLYAGVGLFSLPLARRYARVVAVEGDRVATRYLGKNARAAGVDVEVTTQAVATWIDRLPASAARVVLDPPRLGLVAEIRQTLLDRKPRQITYVSCHPAALARDLKILARGYDLVELVFVDLFPQTAHLEVVAQLEVR